MSDLQPFEDRSADHLRSVLEVSQIGIWELDVTSGFAVRNRTHDQIFGYDDMLEAWSYELFLEHVVEKDRARVDALQRTAIEEQKEWSFECQIITSKGENRWIKAAGRPLQNDGGDTTRLIGHVIDITDSKQNEARLQLVTEELNHRVRNMLAMIKSMVSMSAKGATDIGEFTKALEGRVGALSRTHDLLINRSSSSMLPSKILRAELSAFAGAEAQVQLSVIEESKLSSSASQGLALVLHELFTNAIKYGALTTDDGSLEVRVNRADNAVTIDWIERGGPVPDTKGTEGFGSVLITNALGTEGRVETELCREGLTCSIVIDAE